MPGASRGAAGRGQRGVDRQRKAGSRAEQSRAREERRLGEERARRAGSNVRRATPAGGGARSAEGVLHIRLNRRVLQVGELEEVQRAVGLVKEGLGVGELQADEGEPSGGMGGHT